MPRCEEARVARRKVTGYLLATGHPVGGPKAWYFAAKGFSLEHPEEFERVLLRIACEGGVVKTEANPWGTKYVVEGEAATPKGEAILLKTVWMVAEEGVPVLVTAYPA